MPEKINSNYSASFQQFVDFADKAYAANKEDTFARFKGMTQEDYQGSFASFLRTSEMKAANDEVRAQFRKAVADMFGGEKFIPDLVRDNMKLEDFGKGKPLTARRIKLVKTAIDTLGGGKFAGGASVDKARSMGYLPHELPKLARVANLYQQATDCTDAEAEAAALDPNSNARRLFDCGGRFTLNAGNFKKGLSLMGKFADWYANIHDDRKVGKLDTPTKLNLVDSLCCRSADKAVLKFLLEEIAVNGGIPLDANNPEAVFGMAKNPAMRFVGRGYTMSFANSLAQIPPEKRSVLYAVFDAFDKLPANAAQLAGRDKISQNALLAARVMKHFDAVTALQAKGKLDRAHLVPLLYSDFNVPANATNAQINGAYETKLVAHGEIVGALHMLVESSGATMDEAVAAINDGRRLDNAPGITSFHGHLEELDGTAAGGRATMIGDLVRPSTPTLIANKAFAIPPENAKFVFHFPDGETLAAKFGSIEAEDVQQSCDAIADKLEAFCGGVHPKQLSSVYFSLSQSGIGGNIKGGLLAQGIQSNEHMAVTFTLSRNDETGAVTIKYSEPEGLPVKFNWTTTIDVDGNAVTTPMRIDYGQYEAEAMTHADGIAVKLPGNDRAAADALIRETLAYCGDDFDLKDIVSKYIYDLCLNGAGNQRSPDQIKAKVDALRANLAEIRATANGNDAAEKAGVRFLHCLCGKSVQPGFIGKFMKATLTAQPGEYAKLSPASTPKQLVQAVIDMRAAIDKVLRGTHVTDVLDGDPEITAATDFAASLIFSRFPAAKLQAAADAFRSEKALKLRSLVSAIEGGDYPSNAGRLTGDQKDAIETQSRNIGGLFAQYNLAAESVLGINRGEYRAFEGDFDKNALGHREIFPLFLDLANTQIVSLAEDERRTGNIMDGLDNARAHADNALAKAGANGSDKVDELIYVALECCAANPDAVKVAGDNIDTILVSNTSNLRSHDEVRERANAIAANFAELQAFSQGNQAIYEAGKRLLASMGGKALPPGTIGKLIRAASNTKIDAIRKLSSRSSGPDIHRAVTQFRDNIVEAMNASGAEEATVGADEKQPCRNFIAAIMMNHCGDRTLHAMRGAFEGETAGKLLVLYGAIANGDFNQGLDQETAVRLEDESGSHMSHLAALKDAIDLAVGGHAGMGLVPFSQNLNADEIGGPDIFNDLVDIASR